MEYTQIINDINDRIDMIREDKEQAERESESCTDLITITAYEGEIQGLLEAVEIIHRHINDNWIPMYNGYPNEVNKYYMVTYIKAINGEIKYLLKDSYLGTLSDGSKKWEIEESDTFTKVVAWMDLPKPYSHI